MSWWIYLLNDAGQPVEVSRHQEGGTYVVGGISQAEINVTYNYGRHFDFRQLEGKTGAETLDILLAATQKLGITRDRDYWAATPGNAGYTCLILSAWASQHPHAVWHVS